MYWFLSQLADKQKLLINHIEHHLKDRMKRRPAAIMDCLASQAYLHTARIQADITQTIAAALAAFYYHLQELDVITSLKRDFSKKQLFYEARMKPYLSVSNDRVPSVTDFEKAREAHKRRSTSKVCQEVDSQIKQAKGILTELKKISPQDGKFVGTEEQFKKEVKALETTCVAVAVNASQLARLAEEFGREGVGAKVECQMEQRWHVWWLVPVVKEKK